MHISLGLFLKFYDLLEDECEDLDIKIAGKKAELSEQHEGDSDFDLYVQKLHAARLKSSEARDLREQAEQVQEHIAFLITIGGLNFTEQEQHPYIVQLMRQAQELNKRAEQLVNTCITH